MPINDSEYEDALDYFYESDSDDAYFSALEEQAGIPKSPFASKAAIRNRRKRAKAEAQKKLAAATSFPAMSMFPRLPNYIPDFSDRSASAMTVSSPPVPKAEKRWRSSADFLAEAAMSKGSKSKGKSGSIKLTSSPEKKTWTVDENEITTFNVDGPMLKKYKEFVDVITQNNISPLYPSFPKLRWGIKRTKQKAKYELWSARLSISYRVKFFINESECKVIILSVAKHD